MDPTDAVPPPARPLDGGCTCGAFRFVVDDAFGYALNCHCSRCRRTTGAAFKPFGGIERDRLRLVAGDPDTLMIVGEPYGHDARCPHCGSMLYSVVRAGEYVHVPYGVLADAPARRPEAHIFVGSKAPWHEITDDLPQHDTF